MSTQWRRSVVFTLLIVSLNDVCVLSQNVGPFVLGPPAFLSNDVLSGYPDLSFDPDYELLNNMLTLAEENGVLPEFIEAILGPEDFIVNDNPQRFSIMPDIRSRNSDHLDEVQFNRAGNPRLILETPLSRGTKSEVVLETPLNRGTTANLVLETQLNRDIGPDVLLETKLNRGLTSNNILYENQLNRGMAPDLVLETQVNKGVGPELILETQINRGVAPGVVFEGPFNRALTSDLVLETQINRGLVPELLLESQLNKGLGPELTFETQLKRDLLNPLMLPTPNPQFFSNVNSVSLNPLGTPPRTKSCIIPQDPMQPPVPASTTSPKPASAPPVGIARPLIRNKNENKSNCSFKAATENINLNCPSTNLLPSQNNVKSFNQLILNDFTSPIFENCPLNLPQQLNPQKILGVTNLSLQEMLLNQLTPATQNRPAQGICRQSIELPQKQSNSELPSISTMLIQQPPPQTTKSYPMLQPEELKVNQKVNNLESAIPCQQIVGNCPQYQTSEKFQLPVSTFQQPVLSPPSPYSQSTDCPITFTEKPYFNPVSTLSLVPQNVVADTIDRCPVAPTMSKVTLSRLTPPVKQSVIMSQSENKNGPSIPGCRYQPLTSIPNVKTPLLRQVSNFQPRPQVAILEQSCEISKETINTPIPDYRYQNLTSIPNVKTPLLRQVSNLNTRPEVAVPAQLCETSKETGKSFKPLSSQLFTRPPTAASTNCAPLFPRKYFTDSPVNLDLSPFQQSFPTQPNINCPTLSPKTINLLQTQTETLPSLQNYLDTSKTPCSKLIPNRLNISKTFAPQLTSNNLQLKESNTASLSQSVFCSEKSTKNLSGLSKPLQDSITAHNLRNKISNLILQQSDNPVATDSCYFSTSNLPNRQTDITVNPKFSQYYVPNSEETNNCNTVCPSTLSEIKHFPNDSTKKFLLSQQSFQDQLPINSFSSIPQFNYMPMYPPFNSQDYAYMQPVPVIPIINPIHTFIHTNTNIEDTSPVVVLPQENCTNTAVTSIASAETIAIQPSVDVKKVMNEIPTTIVQHESIPKIRDDSIKISEIAVKPSFDESNAIPVTVSAPIIALSSPSPTPSVSSSPTFPVFPVYPPPMPIIIVDNPRSKSRDWLPILLVALLGNCGNCGSNNYYGYCNSCCNNQNMPCPIPIALCDPIVNTTDNTSKIKNVADCGTININIIKDDSSGIITVKDDK